MENNSISNAIAIAKEIQDIYRSNIEGIEIIHNEAIIDGPKDTPFENGKFKIKLVIPASYPQLPPKGYFLTKIFHPNVAPSTGEICVDTLKRDWKPDLGLKHILLTIRCLLIHPNPDSALNEDAGKLLNERYTDYDSQARMFTEIYALFHLKSKQANALNDKIISSDPLLQNSFPHSKQIAMKAAKKALKRL